MPLAGSCSATVTNVDLIIIVSINPVLAATAENKSASLCFVAIILAGGAVSAWPAAATRANVSTPAA
jgi:hypothetical protein